jgi:hypothetical protein
MLTQLLYLLAIIAYTGGLNRLFLDSNNKKPAEGRVNLSESSKSVEDVEKKSFKGIVPLCLHKNDFSYFDASA